MLNVHDLSFSYGGVAALCGVSFTAKAGQVKCIIGKNGAGKTTLLNNIIGLLTPSAGSVVLSGQDVTRLPVHRRVREAMALVPQGRQIFPRLTVEQNLKVGLEGRADRRRTIPEEIYRSFPKLQELAGSLGGQLSGGEQQQLAIARALVSAPKILLLDEPTEGVEPQVVKAIGHVLRHFAKGGTPESPDPMAIILVEQNVNFVERFGETFHLMVQGTLDSEQNVRGDLTPEVKRSLFGIG